MKSRTEYFIKIIIISALFLFLCDLMVANYTLADETAFLYNRGNQFYRDGNFAEAIESYKQVLFKVDHPEVFYNLGNAYFRSGDTGNARLNYERALKLNPRDQDTRQNMSYLKQLKKDAVIESEQSFFEKALYSIVNWLSLNEWIGLSLAFYLLGMTTLFLFIVMPGNKIRPIFIVFSIIAALLLTTSVPFSGLRYYQDHVEIFAVALSEEVEAHSEPEKDAPLVFSFHAGTKVKLRQTRQEWHQISLPNGLSGWVKSEDIGII